MPFFPIGAEAARVSAKTLAQVKASRRPAARIGVGLKRMGALAPLLINRNRSKPAPQRFIPVRLEIRSGAGF